MAKVKVDYDTCTGCGICIDTCPVVVYELQAINGKTVCAVVAEDQCLACLACVAQCPVQAIEIRGIVDTLCI